MLIGDDFSGLQPTRPRQIAIQRTLPGCIKGDAGTEQPNAIKESSARVD
jgi:hypothetical protein